MKPKVIIIIEGGIVKNVLTNDKELEVSVIDYDTDGIPDNELVNIPCIHNGTDQVYVYKGVETTYWPERVQQLINIR